MKTYVVRRIKNVEELEKELNKALDSWIAAQKEYNEAYEKFTSSQTIIQGLYSEYINKYKTFRIASDYALNIAKKYCDAKRKD